MDEDHRNTAPPVGLHKQKLCARLAGLGRHYKALQQVADQEST